MLVDNLHSFGHFSTVNKDQRWRRRTVWIWYKIWTGITSHSEQNDISFGKTHTATWYKLVGKTSARMSSRRAATVVTRPVSMVNLVNLTRFDLLLPKLDLDGRSCDVCMSGGPGKKNTNRHTLSVMKVVIVKSQVALLASQIFQKAKF